MKIADAPVRKEKWLLYLYKKWELNQMEAKHNQQTLERDAFSKIKVT